MRRRGYLKYLVGGLGIGGGYWALENGVVPGIGPRTLPSLSSAPPETETEIGSSDISNYGSTPFQTITFYESGAAQVLFSSDQNIDRFGFTHSDLRMYEDAFDTWEAPRFEGPKVINLKPLVTNNGPYPRNDFTLGVYFDPSEAVYLGDDAQFAIPSSWYEEASRD